MKQELGQECFRAKSQQKQIFILLRFFLISLLVEETYSGFQIKYCPFLWIRILHFCVHGIRCDQLHNVGNLESSF
jgi:hypothetical protein